MVLKYSKPPALGESPTRRGCRFLNPSCFRKEPTMAEPLLKADEAAQYLRICTKQLWLMTAP